MHNLINAIPLYNFLKYCNASSLEKSILDCGAGGTNPPLSLFHEFGYSVSGIELDDEQLKKAISFADNHHINLNITKGDMKNIPFGDESFSFLFSYNTSVHMTKKDFFNSMREFYRVLKSDGLCYVNFLTVDSQTFGNGKEVQKGEFLSIEDNEEVYYSHYDESEIESKLNGFRILYKQKRVTRRIINQEEYTSGFLDYILQKK